MFGPEQACEIESAIELGSEHAVERLHRFVPDELVANQPGAVDQPDRFAEPMAPAAQNLGEAVGIADIDRDVLDLGTRGAQTFQVPADLARRPESLVSALEVRRRDRLAVATETLVEPGLELRRTRQPIDLNVVRRGR